MTGYSHIEKFLVSERSRITELGGSSIPMSKIYRIMDTLDLDDYRRMNFDGGECVRRKLEAFLAPYELTIPFKWMENCETLKP